MIPMKMGKKDYEKVRIGEFINGVIEDIKYDMEHKFIWKGKEKIHPAARIVFKLEGYQYNHGTKWLNFNYGEKSNLYIKYLSKLVDNAVPDMEFDLDLLKGLKVKTLWNEKNDFQEIESIFPLEKKCVFNPVAKPEAPVEEVTEDNPDEDLPF